MGRSATNETGWLTLHIVDAVPLARTDPPVPVTIRTRVTREEYAELQRMADEDCSSVSQVVRRMVRRQIARRPTADVPLTA